MIAGLWRGGQGWAPPAGFIDYSVCLARISPPLRIGPTRLAAARGTYNEILLGRAFAALGLAHGHDMRVRLDLARVASLLTRSGTGVEIDALRSLSRLGVIDLAVSCSTAPRPRSLRVRRLMLPLSPAKPHLGHVLACGGREAPAPGEGGNRSFPPLAPPRLLERFALLVEAGLDIEAESQSGRRPLHVAVLTKNLAATDALIRLGAELNARDHAAFTPLMLAARGGDTALAKRLLEAGARADLGERVSGPTPLQLAQHMGAPASILDLIRRTRNALHDAPTQLASGRPSAGPAQSPAPQAQPPSP